MAGRLTGLTQGTSRMTTHNLPLINRFKSRVVFHSPDDKNGCDLIPDDKLSGDEYGRIRVDGRLERLHRVAYTLFIGPIPQGMCVCHTCDTRNCVRPEHLFL